MPPGLRRKSMAVGTRAAITMASCPAPLVMLLRGQARGFDCVGEIRCEPLVHGNGGLIHLLRAFESEPALLGDGLRLRKKRFHGGFARRIVGVANVKAHARSSGDYIGCVWFDFDFAHGGDQAVGASRERIRPR